jgi:hypothetical protein
VDILFVVTEGLAGGINYCEKTKSFCYILSLNSLKKKSFIGKMFFAYLFKRFETTLYGFHQVQED